MSWQVYNQQTGELKTYPSNDGPIGTPVITYPNGKPGATPVTTTPPPSTNTNNPPVVTQPTSNHTLLFSAYGYDIYSDATATTITAPDGSGRQAVKWTNPDGSWVWQTTGGDQVRDYAPQYYSGNTPATPPISQQSTAPTVTPPATTAPASTTTKLPNGVIVRDKSTNKMWFVDNGTKREIASPAVLTTGAGYVDIDSSHLSSIPIGSTITTKPTFNFKTTAQVQSLLDATGINWTQPAGYNQTNPPATNPPATNPPATNPPATNPPATNPPATGNEATLYGPNGQLEKVTIGSPRASDLQKLGWGLTPGSYKVPTTTPTNPDVPGALPTADSDKVIYKQGADLYVKSGDSFYKISDPNALYDLVVNKGYKDTRLALPTGAKIGNLQTSNPDLPTNDSDKIIYKRGSDLYVKSGNSYYKISDPTALYDLVVNKGYKDTRVEMPTDAVIGQFGETKPFDPANPTGAEKPVYDPFEEAAKYGYTRDEIIAKDPNFGTYWGSKTPEQLKAALAARSDWDPATNKKKITAAPTPGIYGSTETLPASVETWTGQFIGTVLTSLKQDGSIDKVLYDKIVNDPVAIGKYMKALLYGGYTMDDVYRDIKIQDLAAKGDTRYTGMKGIDETIKADAFYASDAGKKVKADTMIAPSLGLSGMDASLFNNPIFKIPGQAFSTIVKPIDWNSPEFKAEADKIKASYYDILNQSYEAQTNQDKAIAQNNWNTFTKNLQDKYNIGLGNNVKNAWTQLEQLFAQSNEAGTLSSGLVNELTDKYLTDTRRAQNVNRTDMTDTKDLERRKYLMQSGTPAEIAAYVNEVGQSKAAEYGFIPSAETKSFYNAANLKAQYPDMSDAEIQNVIGSMVDVNGNYNSKLYQQLSANKYTTGKEKEQYQQGKLQEQKLAEEQKAYAPFTSSNPLSSYQPEYLGTDKSGALPAPYVGSDSSKWSINQPTTQSYKLPGSTGLTSGNTNVIKPWSAPTGYEKVPNPDALVNYTDTIKNPTTGAIDIWGKKKTTF